jgi:hypothetical protein
LIVWVDKRGPGHLKSLNNIFKAFFERGLINNIEKQFKKDIIEFEYTFYFLIEYNTKVLFAFTKDGKFDKMGYFSLFLQNLDLWGFVMSYLPILECLNDSYKKLCESELKIIEKIKNVILYIVECSDKPIDNDKLVKSLEELTPLFLESEKKSKIQFKHLTSDSSTSSTSSSSSSNSTKKNNTSKSKSLLTSLMEKTKSKTKRNTHTKYK